LHVTTGGGYSTTHTNVHTDTDTQIAINRRTA